jgi:hypothetical protein
MTFQADFFEDPVTLEFELNIGIWKYEKMMVRKKKVEWIDQTVNQYFVGQNLALKFKVL